MSCVWFDVVWAEKFIKFAMYLKMEKKTVSEKLGTSVQISEFKLSVFLIDQIRTYFFHLLWFWRFFFFLTHTAITFACTFSNIAVNACLRIKKRTSNCLVSFIELIEYLVIFLRIHDKLGAIKNRIHLAVNAQMGRSISVAKWKFSFRIM